ncbi:hypothetical protein BGW37DRAFT_493251 [Umbelopsis sp. PMI_123]|nr:hypothetical protein BGW37DRAFT_493251 [Umbelopsis sp. PMI_123]
MTKTGSDKKVITETQYILLDLEDNAPEDILETTEANGGYSLIGLDTPTPYLQLGSEIYKGEFDETIGSNLFLEKVPKGESDYLLNATNEGSQPFNFSYVGSTSKTIKFRRVNLKKKDESISVRESDDGKDSTDAKEEISKKDDGDQESFVHWAA